MFSKLSLIKPPAWLLLGLTLATAIFGIIASSTNAIPANILLYVAQPVFALLIAALAHAFTRGQGDRIQKTTDKAVVVGSVLAIWFVIYFATGIFVTFVNNALVSNISSVLLNIIGFGVTAAATEYTRHRIMLLARRRNAIWFGIAVTLVFALPYINLSHLASLGTGEDIIKLLVSDIAPGLVGSALSTYLAVAYGLPAQMTYRLGVVAMAILPPIIPKYDWYLLGVTSILLSVIVYIVVDRTQRHTQPARSKHRATRAFNIMWAGCIVALILFMTGFFAYKPSAIMSDSMKPVFSRGSLVIVKKNVPTMDISVGDIIQYESHSRVIMHRVIKIEQSDDGNGKRIFITKGDNNPSQDLPVNESQVSGVVSTQIPYAGYPTVWLREITVGNESKEVNG